MAPTGMVASGMVKIVVVMSARDSVRTVKVSFDSPSLDRIPLIVSDGTSSGTDCSSTLQRSDTVRGSEPYLSLRFRPRPRLVVTTKKHSVRPASPSNQRSPPSRRSKPRNLSTETPRRWNLHNTYQQHLLHRLIRGHLPSPPADARIVEQREKHHWARSR
jgi:hypothetical protein